jgi:hypothetical protein
MFTYLVLNSTKINYRYITTYAVVYAVPETAMCFLNWARSDSEMIKWTVSEKVRKVSLFVAL